MAFFSASDGGAQIEKTIEKAVEARRKPIEKKEEQIETEKKKISAFDTLGQYLKQLGIFANKLYGFESVFKQPAFLSDSSALEGTASRTADLNDYRIKINSLAQAHIISSDPLPSDLDLPEGNVRFGIDKDEFEFSFPGGSLFKFERAFKAFASGYDEFSFKRIKKGADESVFIISSKKTGKSRSIRLISDPSEIFLTLGFFEENQDDVVRTRVIPEDLLRNLPSGVTKDGEYLVLDPFASWTFPPKVFQNQSGIKNIEVIVKWDKIKNQGDSVSDKPPSEQDPVSKPQLNDSSEKNPSREFFRINKTFRVGTSNLYFLNPALDPYDVDRGEAPAEDLADDVKPDSASAGDQTQQAASLRPFSSKRSRGTNISGDCIVLNDGVLSLSDDFTNRLSGEKTFRIDYKKHHKNGIKYVNRNSRYILSFTFPEMLSATKGDKKKWMPRHELKAPRNAEIVFEGVTVTRPDNHIDDLVEGITLRLNRTTDSSVTITVESDKELIEQSLINLIGQYNMTIRFLNALEARGQPDDELDEALKKYYGLFYGESMLRVLKTRLRRIMTAAYPTAAQDELTMLKQIGVSTVFEMGGSQSLDSGVLELNETEFRESLDQYIDLLGDLFGYDTDGDQRIDHGISYRLRELVKPYTSRGGMLDLNQRSRRRLIASLEEEIEEEEEEVAAYRQQLTEDFAEMQQAKEQMDKLGKQFDNMK